MLNLSDKDMEEFKRVWDEVRLCHSLLRQKRAGIVAVRRKDGRIIRYTRPVAYPGADAKATEVNGYGK